MKGEEKTTMENKWEELSDPENEKLKLESDSTYIPVSDFDCRAVFLRLLELWFLFLLLGLSFYGEQ